MQISVRLNAALAQMTASPRLQVSVEDGATVADVLHALAMTYPGLGTRLERAVRLEGLGTFTPGIDLEGKISINHRPDVALTNALNTPGFFEGDIIHRDNIGKQMDDLVGLWNEEHPEDLLPTEG